MTSNKIPNLDHVEQATGKTEHDVTLALYNLLANEQDSNVRMEIIRLFREARSAATAK